MKGKDTDKSVNKRSMPREKNGKQISLVRPHRQGHFRRIKIRQSRQHTNRARTRQPRRKLVQTHNRNREIIRKLVPALAQNRPGKPRGKAKAKTNKVCEDYQQRLEAIGTC